MSIINVYSIVNNIFLLHLTFQFVIFMFLQISQHWIIFLYHMLWCPSNSCIPHLCIDLDVLQIEAVTRRILSIKATNHKSKVLVFSSWNDVLDVLEHAFATNNITFIRMKGGRYNNLCYRYFIFHLSIYARLEDIWRRKKRNTIGRQKLWSKPYFGS